MGQSPSQESNYQIDLQIDKYSYQIQDKVQGYVEFQAKQLTTKYDLELKLQFDGNYQQQAWESVGGDNSFIFKEEVIKNCSSSDIDIREKASFQFDLDLISTTAREDGWFFVEYYIRALIQHKFAETIIILLHKDMNFQVHRPYVKLKRPISQDQSCQIQTAFCCNYGQIYLNASLDEKDYLLNDVAQVNIECDQSLATTEINLFQINLLAKTTYRDSRDFCQTRVVLNTVSVSGQQSKKYQLQQSIPLICQERQQHQFHCSLECPNLTHSYFLEIVCNTGLFTNKIVIEMPIILYWTQQYQLKLLYNSDKLDRNSFNEDTFEQYKIQRFIQQKIIQEKWKDQVIDFPEQQKKQDQEQELNNNLIVIQSNKR